MYHDTSRRRPYRSEVRRVTACAECHRRKQKCNRQTPCNVCTERGVPSRCSYLAVPRETDVLRKQFPGIGNPERPKWNGNALELSSQIGYSHPSRRGESSNALDEFLDNDPGHISGTTGQSILASRIPPRQCKELNQLVMKLPSAAVMQELLKTFFSEANWYFTVLDQFYFDKAHRKWLRSWNFIPAATEQQVSADSLYFPALLFQVLALGVQFVPSNSAAEKAALSLSTRSLDQLSHHLSETGERILNILGRHIHAITAIQADIMRCAWLKNSGRGAEAWYSLGNAVRQAQDQKLHLEPETRQTEDMAEKLRGAWYGEHKRRLWACLFTWESHMALQLGRARMINANDCTIKPPLDSDMPENPSRTIFMATDPDERPSHYTSACVKYYLAQQIHKMMSLGALKSDFNDYSIIQSVHTEVTQLLNDLPPAVRPEAPDESWDVRYPEVVKHRLQISIIANSFLLSLHRPLVARHPQSLKLAIAAAIQVLDATQLLFGRTERHQHKTYTLVFYTIDAGVILSAMVAKFPRESDWAKQQTITALRQAVIRLSVLKERNPAAIAGEQVLTQCLEKLGCGLEKPQTKSQNHLPEMQRQVFDQGSPNPPHRPHGELQNAQDEDPTHRPFVEATTVASDGNMTQDGSTWSQGQGVVDAQDLFAEVINDSAYTATWLEQMNNISSMDFGFQDEAFSRNATYW